MQRYPMTPEQIDLVRKSFDALWPFRRKLADQFYDRFFELAPDTRRLFPTDMEKAAAQADGYDRRDCWDARST
jgi:hemoglobin-like flavoprotein